MDDVLLRETPSPPLAPAIADAPPKPDMVRIPGGTFHMGSDKHYPEEAPVQVTLNAGAAAVSLCACPNWSFMK